MTDNKKTRDKLDSNTLDLLTDIIKDIRQTRELTIVLLQCFNDKDSIKDATKFIINNSYKTLNEVIIYRLFDTAENLQEIIDEIDVKK